MLVAIIGGKLQGVEVTYLAQQAGWDVRLIDKNPRAPASLMCDHFLPLTITTETEAPEVLKHVDLIIPAVEDDGVLDILQAWSADTGIPLAFDAEAYAVSSSKKRSNAMFRSLGLSIPEPWPQCGFPLVVKPDGQSGSQGVKVIHNENELNSHVPTRAALGCGVAQAYLTGPLYSLEIMGSPGRYTPFQVTELNMDSMHDCKRVWAPADLDPGLIREFEQIAVAMAEHIQLRGLMDVEVVLHEGRLNMLEIDARLPSQTPTAVFQSTGVNMVEQLGELCLGGQRSMARGNRARTTLYEHIEVIDGRIKVAGEHIMGCAGPLRRVEGLFGADEVITNYRPGLDAWVATLILNGKNREEVLGKRQQTYENVRHGFG